MYSLIVFDMDGTLLNTNQMVMQIYQRYFKLHPSPVKPSILPMQEFLAKSYEEILKILQVEPLQEHLSYIQAIHDDMMGKKLKVYRYAKTLLATLKIQGIKIALLTSEMKSIALKELEFTGLLPFFDAMVMFDDVEKPKPDPEGFQKLLRHFNVPLDKVLFVGDQLGDYQTGKAVGVTTVGIHHAHEKKLPFVRTFPNLKELQIYILNEQETHHFAIPEQGFKILQFTDLHLKGDHEDPPTWQLIDDMIQQIQPHFIVFTGDQTMSDQAPLYYEQLGQKMDAYRIPFTYIFGNHDSEFNDHMSLLQAIQSSRYLYFYPGPKKLGYSNFVIHLETNKPVMDLLFLDSHVDRTYTIDKKKVWGYDRISLAQMDYMDTLTDPKLPKLAFMHIPFKEFALVKPDEKDRYFGTYDESCSVAPQDEGIFEWCLRQHIQGVFVGHDHLNDFEFKLDGVSLIYGRCSGHYNYAKPEFIKGARTITILPNGEWVTKVFLHTTSSVI